jgi:hypothetical protein
MTRSLAKARWLLAGIVVLICGTAIFAQPITTAPPGPRKHPPRGIPISATDRDELTLRLQALEQEIAAAEKTVADRPALLALLPDAQIFHKAVQYALDYDEFFRTNEVAIARSLLERGSERAAALRAGVAPWTSATGLVVRGFKSRIDGSIQPYGLVVPSSFRTNAPENFRLDVWLHGRDNHLTELKFLHDRQRSAGEFSPADAFVLHPYGRYCNAFKFAGETDLFEALALAQANYPIDPRRLAIRGFSMGGAGTWHLAVHHAGFWAAAAPGAGFAETPRYTRILERYPGVPWFEQTLWKLYDAPAYAANLIHCPVVAYSGELDKQKQAADLMAEAMAEQGLTLAHLIGPGTEHKYHPQTKIEIARRIDALLQPPRDPFPRSVRFVTWTLRYSQLAWVQLEGLDAHWKKAEVTAKILDDQTVRVETENVSAIRLSFPAGTCPLDNTLSPRVVLDGTTVTAPRVQTDRSWQARFEKQKGKWRASAPPRVSELRKRPGLQGPIDDAFYDAFLFVRPTGISSNNAVADWIRAAMDQAIQDWRAQFRGQPEVKDDRDVTVNDVETKHLVLWGDPQSNRLTREIADRLPIAWRSDRLAVGRETFDASRHLLAMIYPNPLNPKRYVVLNSGFTFASMGPLSNALQTPKLPDYAVLGIESTGNPWLDKAVRRAGFFGERWELIDSPAK